MILLTDEFKGNLTELLGKTASEAMQGLAPPRGRFPEAGGIERLEWEETVENTESGRRFTIHPSLRIEKGRVVEVGIRSDDFLFMVDLNEQGAPFFAAVPKEGEFDPAEVNWVRQEDGIPFNWEVS